MNPPPINPGPAPGYKEPGTWDAWHARWMLAVLADRRDGCGLFGGSW